LKKYFYFIYCFKEYARVRLTAYYLMRDMLTGANGNEQAQMPPQFDEELLRSTKNPFHKSYIKAADKIV
jgi:hypothetical protein